MESKNICELCESEFKSEGRLKRHLVTKKHLHNEKINDESNKQLKVRNNKERIRNKKRENRESGKHRCNTCKRNYGSNSDLNKHMRTKIHTLNSGCSTSDTSEISETSETSED